MAAILENFSSLNILTPNLYKVAVANTNETLTI